MDTLPATGGQPGQSLSRPRLDSVDTLRGMVMVIMALDHTRDFFSKDLTFAPTDLAQTYPALFLTRWFTHYCAPVFMFLAGTGAFLSTTRGKSKKELSWFLLSRGLWLVFLPVPVISLFGVAMVVTHNGLDAVTAESWGTMGWLWRILHTGGLLDSGNGYRFVAAYPLIPWIGVMAAGYG